MTELQISSFRLMSFRIHPGAASNARTQWTVRQGVNLSVQAGVLEGRGEASPLPGYSFETLDQARGALASMNPDRLRLDLSDPLASVCAVGQDVLPAGVPSARFALETALLDLAGQYLSQPVERLLGPCPPGKRLTAELLTEPSSALPMARKVVSAGGTSVKLKVGRPGSWSVEWIAIQGLLRELPELKLRLDANQAFDRDTPTRLDQLHAAGIEFIEEPGPFAAWRDLVRAPPLALDETLRGDDAEAILEEASPRLGAVVLKPAVLGGLSPAVRWACRAERYGVPAVVSHLFDGPVAAAALRALARALPGGGPAHGLGFERAGGPEVLASERSGLDLPLQWGSR